MDDSLSNQPDRAEDEKRLSEEIEAEGATSLPNKEVLSLLDVNANVDLGLDFAAPVDLAAAANLNVAAPIEASAAANVLSPGAEAIGLADQHGAIEQTISGQAIATAPQHAQVAQSSGVSGSGAGTADSGSGSPASTDAAAGSAHPAQTGTAPSESGSAAPAATSGTAGLPADAAATNGGASSLLNGGSLLDANVNINADANLAAPVDGAVAANANVAAPIDAAVAANVGSPDAAAVAEAPQQVDIQQNMDHLTADATATQDANVSEKP